jgi:hypothetical protein
MALPLVMERFDLGQARRREEARHAYFLANNNTRSYNENEPYAFYDIFDNIVEQVELHRLRPLTN